VDLTRGVYSEPEDTLLTSRALDYLAQGPADVVDLIGHICSLPGAPRIVAEHMAHAMFAGRREFVLATDGRWMLADRTVKPYAVDRVADIPRVLAARKRDRAVSRAEPTELLSSMSYVVVDTETTGGSHWRTDRITEIAAVIVKNGEIVEVFETLVNPKRSIPYFVSKLTNITWDMVKDAPTFDRIAPDVLRVLEGNVFVGHNAMFDWRFVSAEILRSTGRQLRGRRLCTVKIARQVVPQLSRRSLDYVSRYYGVENHARHRAGGDAVATAKCLIRMLRDLQDRGCSTWGDLETLMRGPLTRRKKKRRASGLPTPVLRDTTA
jgi:DNA polymerase III epsilon subunit family exonuclease